MDAGIDVGWLAGELRPLLKKRPFVMGELGRPARLKATRVVETCGRWVASVAGLRTKTHRPPPQDVEINVDIVTTVLQYLVNIHQGKPLMIAAASKFGEVFVAAGVPTEVGSNKYHISPVSVSKVPVDNMITLAGCPAAGLVVEVSSGCVCQVSSPDEKQPERAASGDQGSHGQPVGDIRRLQCTT